jgi:hypothetical protein
MATETTATDMKMETLVFSETVQDTFTPDEIALSSMVREMIADCGGDDQPIELFTTGKFNDISDVDMLDFIALWKYAATPAAKPVLDQIAVRTTEAQTVTDKVITKLADSKSAKSLCKMIVVANFLAIEPLINVYASRLAKIVNRDPEAFKRAIADS